jgi:hypothetical protein
LEQHQQVQALPSELRAFGAGGQGG